MSNPMNLVFMVDDEPYCIWDPDIQTRNSKYIDSIDSEYFSFAGLAHAEHLDSDDRHRAATATRLAYLHGLETLMTLIGATVQAPEAIYAWAPLCDTGKLREVVLKLQSGDASLRHNIRGFTHTLGSLAKIVFSFAPSDDGWHEETAADFERAWLFFAADFLKPHYQQEYNALKHGFRIRSGGFGLRIGRQPSVGIQAPEHEMVSLGSSQYGTSFYVVEKVSDTKGDRSRRSRRIAVNWSPEALMCALQVIDLSIGNLASYLKVINGAPSGSVRFVRLERSEDYSKAWTHNCGVTSSSLDTGYSIDEIHPTTKAELAATLKSCDGERDS